MDAAPASQQRASQLAPQIRQPLLRCGREVTPEAPRELFLTDLSGVSELQREVLEQTAARLTR